MILVGDEDFQDQAADAMVTPSGSPLLARGTALPARPAGSPLLRTRWRDAVLVIEAKSLLRLLRQPCRQIAPGQRTVAVVRFDELPTLLRELERQRFLEALVGCVTFDRMRETGAVVLWLAMRGITSLPPAGLRLLLEAWHGRERGRVEALNAEERRLLHFLATGASDREMAAAMGLPLHRVRSLVRTVLGKLGCRNRTAAAVLAHRHAACTAMSLAGGARGG